MIVLHIYVKKAKESRPSSNWNYWLQFIAILSSLSAQGFLIWWCCFSVIQACLTLCDPMDCSLAGFPVHNHFPELAQTHVHGVSDAIQPSHSLLPSSPFAFNLSQYQGLFQRVGFASDGQSIGVSASASVLLMNIQDWFPLELTGLISLQSKRLSRAFSNNTIWRHRFFSAQSSLWSKSQICTWLLEKP